MRYVITEAFKCGHVKGLVGYFNSLMRTTWSWSWIRIDKYNQCIYIDNIIKDLR